MAIHKINWDDIGSYEQIEKGWYEAVLETKGQPAEPTRSGNPGQAVVFHLRLPSGRTRRVRRNFAVNSGFFKELVQATGHPTQGEELFDSDVLHGKVVKVWVTPKTNEDTGRGYLELGNVLPANAPTPAAPAGDNGATPVTRATPVMDPVMQQLLGHGG